MNYRLSGQAFVRMHVSFCDGSENLYALPAHSSSAPQQPFAEHKNTCLHFPHPRHHSFSLLLSLSFSSIFNFHFSTTFTLSFSSPREPAS
ncbi:hypothetical protein RJT34_25184 [Clitoria ternatea]|uniref:Uncharacterized protein n=1 Tax=Clitoria ternatea TaxID=43366 RepID=A0AAN9FPA0_CLITE